MKLYHGTSQVSLEKILETGIGPRGKSKGNWEHTVKSHKDAVYMTTAYPLYFATVASGDSRLAAVIEIDTDYLDKTHMAPDEDFLGQVAVRKQGGELNKITRVIRQNLRNYAGDADLLDGSIKFLGNCCYIGTIPVKAISRIARINLAKAPQTHMMSLDPSISIMNYMYVGKRYRALTKWVFGDDLGPDTPLERKFEGDVPEEIRRQFSHEFALPPDSERAAITVDILTK